MPPHWAQAGPRSRPCSFAGMTGGESVIASAAATVLAGCLAVVPPLPGFAPPLPPLRAAVAAVAGVPVARAVPAAVRRRHRCGRVAAHQRLLRRLPGADLG